MNVFAKSPMQMRREAEERGKPKRRPAKPRPVDPAKARLSSAEGRPVLDGANWAAYIRTGEIGDR